MVHKSRNIQTTVLDALLLMGTVCFLLVFSKTVLDQKAFQATIDFNEAIGQEFGLRLASAISSLHQQSKRNSVSGANHLEQKMENCRRTFDSMSVANPMLLADKVILYQRLNLPVDEPLESLRTSSPEGSIMAHDILLALPDSASHKNSAKLLSQGEEEVERDIERHMLPSWYRDYALQQLYAKSEQTAKLDAFLASLASYDVVLVCCAGFVSLSVAIISICGFVVGIVFLHKLWKGWSATTPIDVAPDDRSSRYRLRLVAAAIIAFLLTKAGARLALKEWYNNPIITPENAFASSVSILLVYLLVNGSGLLFFYLFVLRPRGTSFFEGINLKWSTDSSSTLRLIGIGAAGASVCILLCIVTFLLSWACGFSAKSANPFNISMALVVNSSNWPAIVVLFVLVALVIPFIEESFVRGAVYGALRQRCSAFVSVVSSALFFAALHLDLAGFIFLFEFGVVTAYIRERTGSILPTVVIHGMYMCFIYFAILMLRPH